MKNNFNLIFIGVLIISLITTIIAFSGNGNGTSNSPYEITNCTQLQEVEDDLSADYILMNDINCSDTVNWNSGAGFVPIGNSSIRQFSGTFDGRGFIIDSLFINISSPLGNNVGLFGLVGGEIKNLRLENVDINYTGSDTSIKTGSIAGTLNGASNLSNSYSTGNVSGYRKVGGLVGENFGTISSSSSDTKVQARQHHIGGLVGLLAAGIINNSYAKGNVSGDSAVGGFLGTINEGTIINSYSTGNVSGIDSIGGTIGGFMGFVNSAGTISSSYWDVNTSNQETSAGGTGKTTAEMKTQSTFTNWDFIDTWRLDSSVNNGYPYLRVEDFSGGSGNSDNPFVVSTCTQLQNMSLGLDLSYVLMNDINCSDTVNWNSGAGFVPIGNLTSRFNGTIDGEGYVINNLFIDRGSTKAVGLIGYLEGNITYLGMESINITGDVWVGGIAGVAGSGSNILKSYSTGNVAGISDIGGIAGGMTGRHINNSYSKANVTGTSSVGGMVGDDVSPHYSYSIGNVTGDKDTGGLCPVGEQLDTNSYWDINTSGQTTSCNEDENGKTTAEMKTQSTFTNWDFIDTWRLDSSVNNGYPYLTRFYLDFINPTTDNGNFSQDYIQATAESRIDNSDTITINIYNTSLVQSDTTTNDILSSNFTGLVDGTYYLNATVNNTSGDTFSTGTKTILLDTQSPLVDINEPEGNKNSKTIDFNVSLNDNFSYGTCIYWVERGENIEISNTTINCSDSVEGTFTVTLEADFSFHFFVNDSVGNSNTTSSNFSVSIPTGHNQIPSEKIVEVPLNETFCGDNICQEVNDQGFREDFYSCPLDCQGENFDDVLSAFTRNCFDGDDTTLCFWTQGSGGETFSAVPNDGICQISESPFSNDCGGINLETVALNCFDSEEATPCFWNTQFSSYLFIFGFLIVILFSTIQFDTKKGRSTLYKYTVKSLTKKRKKKRR